MITVFLVRKIQNEQNWCAENITEWYIHSVLRFSLRFTTFGIFLENLRDIVSTSGKTGKLGTL